MKMPEENKNVWGFQNPGEKHRNDLVTSEGSFFLPS
jgi:hypothetical protein